MLNERYQEQDQLLPLMAGLDCSLWHSHLQLRLTPTLLSLWPQIPQAQPTPSPASWQLFPVLYDYSWIPVCSLGSGANCLDSNLGPPLPTLCDFAFAVVP
jgi:hypothetical protein